MNEQTTLYGLGVLVNGEEIYECQQARTLF